MFYGWYIVGAGLLMHLFVNGVVSLGFTAVIQPVATELGWSYAQISIAASLRGMEMGLLAPLIGLLVDRVGPRKLIIASAIFICTGYILLSKAVSLPMFYGAFMLIAIGVSCSTGVVLITAVNYWFRKKAGLAVAIVSSGVAFGGLMVPVVTSLVDTLGWRTGMMAIGLGMLAVILPLSLVMRHKPEQYGYLQDGISAEPSTENEKRKTSIANEINLSVKEALKTRTFWCIAISALCTSFIVNSVLTHIMPFLDSLGISRSVASMVAFAIPLMSLSGRLGSVWLGNQLGRKSIFIIGFFCITSALLMLTGLSSIGIWLLIPSVVALGFGWGAIATTRILLLREHFGTKRLGSILGFCDGLQMVGQMTGAPIAGWVFDKWGSYQGAWLAFIAVGIAGVFLTLAIVPTAGRLSLKTEQF